MSYAKIRPRRGTLYEWSTVNPVLYEGEMVIEVPDTGVGTGLSKFKIGDGVSPYNQLPYAFDGAAAASINGGSVGTSHPIQIRSGTAEQWNTINPVLRENEIAYDSTNKSLKLGDGETSWNNLDFIMSEFFLQRVVDFGIPEEYEEDEIDPLLEELMGG